MKTIQLELTEKIKSYPYFFSKKPPVIVNISKINHYTDWFNLYKLISNIGLFIIGVCCCYNNTLKEMIIRSGLPIFSKEHLINFQNKQLTHTKITTHKNNKIQLYSKTRIIYTPIRSGQKIYARNSDLIIIANVSAGAEVIADGNIHIYGMMRGRMLAGASGNKESQIFCTNLYPELISIGGYYWLSDHIPQQYSGKAVRLHLKNNTLTIQHIL